MPAARRLGGSAARRRNGAAWSANGAFTRTAYACTTQSPPQPPQPPPPSPPPPLLPQPPDPPEQPLPPRRRGSSKTRVSCSGARLAPSAPRPSSARLIGIRGSLGPTQAGAEGVAVARVVPRVGGQALPQWAGGQARGGGGWGLHRRRVGVAPMAVGGLQPVALGAGAAGQLWHAAFSFLFLLLF